MEREFFSQKEYKTFKGFTRAAKIMTKRFFGNDDILYTKLQTRMKREECFTVIADDEVLPATIEEILQRTGFISFAESIRDDNNKVVWKRGVEFNFDDGIIYLYEVEKEEFIS